MSQINLLLVEVQVMLREMGSLKRGLILNCLLVQEGKLVSSLIVEGIIELIGFESNFLSFRLADGLLLGGGLLDSLKFLVKVLFCHS